MRTKVTVTVPVYNTSRYLRKCLDSLKAQTLDNIEFILVDDGSTDDSGKICDEYANNDPRFKVIHQKNGGSASARQAGLDASQGEYVIVCDSDDWVEPEMYEKLYSKAQETEADIVVCGYFAEYSDGRSFPIVSTQGNKNRIDYLKRILRYSDHSSWTRLIKRDLFVRAEASYEKGINLGEDSLILYKLLMADPKIVELGVPLYHYRKVLGGESYTNNPKFKQVNQLERVLDWLLVNYDRSIFERELINVEIGIAFAYLRCIDLDTVYFRKYIKAHITVRKLLSCFSPIKGTIVGMSKILPLSLVRSVIKVSSKIIRR